MMLFFLQIIIELQGNEKERTQLTEIFEKYDFNPTTIYNNDNTLFELYNKIYKLFLDIDERISYIINIGEKDENKDKNNTESQVKKALKKDQKHVL